VAPFFRDPVGCDGDLRKLTGLVLSGAMLSCIWDTATSVIRDPTYIRRRHAIESRLLVRPTLDAKDIANVVALD
jgi:hypothetical protein